ncbi:hypothetical protein [Sphingomonas sp. M1A8_2b]
MAEPMWYDRFYRGEYPFGPHGILLALPVSLALWATIIFLIV